MEIRDLTADDGPLLVDFRCAHLREPWAILPEDMVRTKLADSLRLDRRVRAVGGWVEDELVGVAAWVTNDEEHEEWTVAVLAVALDCQGKGYGRGLKREVLRRALDAGVYAVISEVHEENSAMFWVNRKLGGTCERDPVHPEYFNWTFRLREPW